MLELKANWHYGESGDRRHYLVEAWIDGEIQGRAFGWFVEGAEFVLEKIELDPSQRSKGHGSTMIGCLRAKARDAGCRELVFKGVRVSNDGAIRLYESLGAIGGPVADDLRSFVLSPP